MLRRPIILGIATLLVATAAAARAVGDAEKAAFGEVVRSLEAAVRANDAEHIVALTPPGIISHNARVAGTSPAEAHAVLVRGEKAGRDLLDIRSVDADLGNASFSAMPDGTPIALAPVRTHFLMRGAKSGQGMIQHSYAFAILEGDRWYVTDLGEDQPPSLTDAYPGLKRVKLPRGKVEAMK